MKNKQLSVKQAELELVNEIIKSHDTYIGFMKLWSLSNTHLESLDTSELKKYADYLTADIEDIQNPLPDMDVEMLRKYTETNIRALVRYIDASIGKLESKIEDKFSLKIS